MGTLPVVLNFGKDVTGSELVQNQSGVQTKINKTETFQPTADKHKNKVIEKNKILVFKQVMQQMLKHATAYDYEGDAQLLAEAAKIVHKNVVS